MKLSFRLLFPSTALVSALLVIGLSNAQAAVELREQSPIDITSQNTTFNQNLAPLNFNLSSDTALKVINNGSPGEFKTAVRANLVDQSSSTLTVSGDTYKLAQFHFHAPAEHLENGIKFPMEMHLVFQDASNNLLVVGRWVEEGAKNVALDPIFSNIPQNTTTTLSIDHFNLNSLLPANLDSFRYDGSLTTPPFSEGVKWVDLATPMDMSKDQINAFASLFPNPPDVNGDARPVQDLNGRVVLTDVQGFAAPIPEPETYAMLLAGLGLIGFVASRKNRANTLTSGILPA